MLRRLELYLAQKLAAWVFYKNLKRVYLKFFRLFGSNNQTIHLLGNVGEEDIFGTLPGETFGGYYDTKLFNPKIGWAAHNLRPSDNVVRIVTSNGGHVREIGQTTTWNYQQGARLTITEDALVFNTVKAGVLGSAWCDLKRIGDREEFFKYPLQAISATGSVWCSINYSVLNEKAPDYAYPGSFNELAMPGELIIFSNFEVKFRFNVLKAYEQQCGAIDQSYYINHFQFSDDGKTLIGLIRSSTTKGSAFVIVNCLTGELRFFCEPSRISHFCFYMPDTLIFWGTVADHSGYFCFDLKTFVTRICAKLPSMGDGHPSSFDSYVTYDTYPDRYGFSSLYLYTSLQDKVVEIAKYRQPSDLFDINRCDLHPRLISRDEIMFDSAHTGHRRCYKIKLERYE